MNRFGHFSWHDERVTLRAEADAPARWGTVADRRGAHVNQVRQIGQHAAVAALVAALIVLALIAAHYFATGCVAAWRYF